MTKDSGVLDDLQLPPLRRTEVPEAGWPYLDLAQRFGVFDDGYLPDVVDTLSEGERQALARFRCNFPAAIDQWLSGDEAACAEPSPEYMAFSCLYLAADYVMARAPEGRTMGVRTGFRDRGW